MTIVVPLLDSGAYYSNSALFIQLQIVIVVYFYESQNKYKFEKVSLVQLVTLRGKPMLSVPGIAHRCALSLCGKWWIKGEFLVFWSSSCGGGDHQFSPLSFGLLKVMCTERKRSDCHCICSLVAPCSNTDLGVPLVECPKTYGDWTMGSMGPDLLFLCYKTGSALCLILQRRAGQSLLPGFLHGQTLLLTGCLSGNWRHVLGCISCVSLGLLHLVQHCGKAWVAAILSLLCSQTERGTCVLVVCEWCCTFSVLLQSQCL